MSTFPIDDPEIQRRCCRLSEILCVHVRYARDAVAIQLAGTTSKASVYRMMDGGRFGTQQRWTKPAAIGLVNVLEANGLCNPNLFDRLFGLPIPQEILDADPTPEVVNPNPLAVKRFINSRINPAERSDLNLHVFAGRLCPPFTNGRIERLETEATLVVPPKFFASTQRAIVAYTNLSLNLWHSHPSVSRNIYIAEDVIFAVLGGKNQYSKFSVVQRQRYLTGVTNNISKCEGMTVGLIDRARLIDADLKLLGAKIHTFYGALDDPVLRIRWPNNDAAWHHWQKPHDQTVKLLNQREKAAFDRLSQTLTHAPGHENFLDRLQILAFDAGIVSDSDWLGSP